MYRPSNRYTRNEEIKNCIICSLWCFPKEEENKRREKIKLFGILYIKYFLNIEKNRIDKKYFFLPIKEFERNKGYYLEQVLIPDTEEVYETLRKFREEELEIENLKEYEIREKNLTPYHIG